MPFPKWHILSRKGLSSEHKLNGQQESKTLAKFMEEDEKDGVQSDRIQS